MRKIILCALICVLLVFSSCAPRAVEARAWAYDTYCTARVWGGSNISEVFSSACADGETLLSASGDKQFTATRDGDSIPLSGELYGILLRAQTLYTLTDGLYDLTVAPLSALWDVNSAQTPPSSEEIEETLSLVGWDGVTLTEDLLTFSSAGMGIDIGSVGKGYGADRTADALKRAGAEAGVLSFGGNVALFGTNGSKEFRIGIRDPQSAEETFGVLTLTDTSVVTSGAYERYFESDGVRYHHLLDPLTGYPRESDLLSVTAVCTDGAQADMVSTALWLMGFEKGWKLYETLCQTEGFAPFEVIFVRNDGTVRVSDGLSGRFELTSSDYTLEES